MLYFLKGHIPLDVLLRRFLILLQSAGEVVRYLYVFPRSVENEDYSRVFSPGISRWEYRASSRTGKRRMEYSLNVLTGLLFFYNLCKKNGIESSFLVEIKEWLIKARTVKLYRWILKQSKKHSNYFRYFTDRELEIYFELLQIFNTFFLLI